MQFKNANEVSGTCFYLRLADLRRGENRALIDNLANGMPPWTAQEAVQNNFQNNVNVNNLTLTRALAAMRRQFFNAMLKPGKAFTVQCDYGPKFKQRDISEIITTEINHRIKKGFSAKRYAECQRSKFAQVSIHGVGPTEWSDRETWCPQLHSMSDVMIPSMTLRDMSNLSHFAIYRRYTAYQLFKKVHGPRVDKAWNVKLADSCIQWALKQSGSTVSPTDYEYNPERWAEAVKEGGGVSGVWNSDQIPTINAFDFFYCDPDKKESGWKRCMVLDAPDGMSSSVEGAKDQWLYNATSRIYSPSLDQILHFQYADGSVVAPFLYHSVRSLGFLLYSTCHLQNRLYCRFHDNVFESLMQYFRISNPNDSERVIKMNLQNYGIVPDGVTMLPKSERWQTDAQLVNMAMAMNQSLVADSAADYSQDFGMDDSEQPEKTATQINAEMNATSAMVGSMLSDAYDYETYAYQEICRRFCIPNSKDPDVREFRKQCLKQGVPEDALNHSRWDVSPERIIGAGNKALELGMIQGLMSRYHLYEPTSQRIILKMATMSDTDDPALSNVLVPLQPPQTTTATHDAELSSVVLLQGIPMGLKEGVSHAEYAATLIGILNVEVQKILQSGGITTAERIAGLENLAGQTSEGQPIEGNGASNHIAILAQDPGEKQAVKQLSDTLSKLLNEVRAMKQRLEEAQAQGHNGQPELTAEDAVKLKSQLLLAQAKADNMRTAHEQRSQQRAEIHEQNLQEKQAKDQLENANTIRRSQVEESATDLRTAAEIQRQNAKAEAEPATTKTE